MIKENGRATPTSEVGGGRSKKEVAMTRSEHNQLVVDLAYKVVAQNAQDEISSFQVVSKAYLKKGDKIFKDKTSNDHMLGSGMIEAVSLLTPIVLSIATEVVMSVTGEVKKSLLEQIASWVNDFIKKIFKGILPDEQKDKKTLPKLTKEELVQVHKIAYEKACTLNLPEAQARLLADSIVGNLVTLVS
jgi:hypothetical protein